MGLLVGDGTSYHFWMVVLAIMLVIAGLVRLIQKDFFCSKVRGQPKILGCGDPDSHVRVPDAEVSTPTKIKKSPRRIPSLWLVVPVAFVALYIAGYTLSLHDALPIYRKSVV